ncbi:MAG: Na/Pi cotransporter family protein [Clostridia bacterium]|nr:Na/Pi cotransporter family protein [Clostridia bacterium]
MGITEILGLLGGLALFLYGMQMMSNGLEDAAGNKMKKILEKLTSNRFLGVLVGAGITAVIQSSSATTVMVVGFVNSAMITLRQAVWIIMGANIGTTITGQLIALDIGLIAPLIAFLGVASIVFLKNEKIHHYGKIAAGLGILFIGMGMMSDAMVPLRESQMFIDLMTKFSNPLLGIAAGAIFTAVIQSSSASVGILQALAVAGLIDFRAAVFVLFGQNIGTCITALLAAIGTNRAAKRTTVIHLSFNLIGTAIFTTVCLLMPSVTDIVASFTPDNMSAQIANMHTIFNVTTTLLLLPFGAYLAKFAEKILPDRKAELSGIGAINEEFRRGNIRLGEAAIHTDVLKQEIDNIISLTNENLNKAYTAVINKNAKSLDTIADREEKIDVLNKEISQYISKILVHISDKKNVADIEQYLLITGNAERIGDHAINIANYVKSIEKYNIEFSDGARDEIAKMQEISNLALNKAVTPQEDRALWIKEVEELEQEIDNMTDGYRAQHLARMHEGKCNEEACILYSELLTDFERIGDHILNIAQANVKIYNINRKLHR